MANYVSSTFMKSFNPYRVYNTSSKPTLNQVSSYIPVISAEMDARMSGAGITVPIATSPASGVSRYLKLIAAWGTAGTAEEAAFMGGNRNSSEHAEKLLERYYKALSDIENNPAIITAQTDGDYGAVFDSYEYSNSDKARDYDDEPFQRDEDNW